MSPVVSVNSKTHQENLRADAAGPVPGTVAKESGCRFLGTGETLTLKVEMIWGCDPAAPLPSPPLPGKSRAVEPLTRPGSTERGRRPGPRPGGTSSSSPPSSPGQKAAHPPGSRHCRGQDGGAGAGARGWERESYRLRRRGSGSSGARVPAALSKGPAAAPTGALHRTPGTPAAAGSSAPASSSRRRRHCRPMSPPPVPALAPCLRRPTAAAYSPPNSQSPTGPRHLTHS